MDDQYKTFFKILRPITRYAVDLTLSELNAGDDEQDQDRDELPESFKIGRDQFFDSLYENRGDEAFILDFLRTSKDLICIVGPRGSGKTSMGCKITKILSDSPLHRYFIAFIDIRVQSNLYSLESYDRDAFRDFLLEQVKSNYMFDLFAYKRMRSKENPEVKLWAYLLKRSDDMPSQLFSSFWRIQNRAAQLFDAYQAEDWQRREAASYYDWLMATHNTDAEVSTLTDAVREMVRIPHLVYAAKDIYGYSKQFIWFDNIDALPEGLQSETVSVLKRNHGLVSDYVSTVIAVREENVFRIYDTEHSAPPHITRVNIDIERNDKGNAIYSEVDAGHPAIGIPLIKKQTLTKIVHNRLAFTKSVQASKHSEITQMISHEQAQLSAMVDAEQISRTELRIRELRKELSFYSPLITDECYSYVLQLSNKMLDAIYREGIHLANNSLRDFLMMQRDFLAELLKDSATDSLRPSALDYERRSIITRFLRWIRTTPRKFRIAIYDIVEETERWYNGDKQTVGCILPHLVITTIWNLTLENVVNVGGKQLYLNPTVGEVVYCLSGLGFERQRILETLLALHKHGDSSPRTREQAYGQVVEFRSSKFINRIEEMEDEHVVYVTYRGKCFVGLTCNTFGYLYECIECTRKNDLLVRTREQKEASRPQSSLEEIDWILPSLCDIAQMHYETFRRLRDSSYQNDKDWFVKYCSRFGIPRIPPYTRGRDIGIQVENVRRALQFEALIDGVIGYFHKEPGSDRLEELRRLFMQAVEVLSRFQDTSTSTTDFRSKLGIEPRANGPTL